MAYLTVLCFGDVVGRPGRRGLCQAIPVLRARYGADWVVANAENAAGGSGLTPSTWQKISSYGVNVATTGDHFFRNKEFPGVTAEPGVLRPANYPKAALGQGWALYQAPGPVPILVINLLGRIFMEAYRCPFEVVDEILLQAGSQAKVIFVDMHAEATSEKMALGWYLDGRVSCVFGTHTHVQTADDRLLPHGTAYVTDLGMTGPYEGVIGRLKDPVIHRLRTGMPARFEVAEKDVRACGIAVRVDPATGKAVFIERFQWRLDEAPAPAAPEPEAGDAADAAEA